MEGEGSDEAKAGALLVLIFWANLSLAVLTRVVLTKKKRVNLGGKMTDSGLICQNKVWKCFLALR